MSYETYTTRVVEAENGLISATVEGGVVALNTVGSSHNLTADQTRELIQMLQDSLAEATGGALRLHNAWINAGVAEWGASNV